MNLKLIIILLIGTCAMMIPMFFQARKYEIKVWKIIPVAFVLTVVGTIGTYLWFLLENLHWGGRSFFGAVFLVPIAFLLIAPIVRIPYGQLVDLCAPAECIMLSIMKVQCLIEGCCAGRILFMTDLGGVVRFPSQLVELIVAYVLVWLLLVISHKTEQREKVYPWYLILYGASRFILNFFREEWAKYDGGIPPLGTVWSVCAVIIGILWIVIYNKRHDTSEKELV